MLGVGEKEKTWRVDRP